ncbi:cysteine protease ATG4B [Ischnura elegans]|uniref:cysteine protease ATG4B n=1 Tax=Ischnura elegans TaxID=197161 RepID=UPI001ED89928|nr:cysteine protease ATG4B [Ischnura elegans]XP_046402194.1 cysteine protease ATG4B [Ischnura elegans]XP_046402195.1 cysteine protease ATG4B [Ischnura elegans]XP_046402196.1 cysteine protease ATG4B [Ischnura elegans]
MDMMFEAYLTHEANSKAEDIPVTTEPVWILGKKYSSIHNLDEIRKDIQSRLWFTYRKGFIPIGDTGLTSDKGWGCMLRCGQMVLGQALIHLHLGREWRWPGQSGDDYGKYVRILRMFEDRRAAPFSIHQIALMGASSEGKAVGEWFGPNTIAQVLRKLAVSDEWSSLVVHVAMDNTVIIGNIKRECFRGGVERGAWRPLLLVVPLRLGLSEINPVYVHGLKVCFTFKQSLGVIGGKPNHALYFIGCVGDEVIFLDPHTTQPTASVAPAEREQQGGEATADGSYHCAFASRIHILGMDPSVAVCFFCPTEKDFDGLCSQIQQQIVRPERQPLFELCADSHWSSPPSSSASPAQCSRRDDSAVKLSAKAAVVREAACIALDDFDRQFDDSDEDFELLG